jgi:hypothetical protein
MAGFMRRPTLDLLLGKPAVVPQVEADGQGGCAQIRHKNAPFLVKNCIPANVTMCRTAVSRPANFVYH